MVGSLLRTAPLKEARERRARGEIDAAALRAVEDAEIVKLIARQEATGLRAITDGEFRRAYWHFDFLEGLEGVESVSADSGMNFKGGVGITKALRINGKVGFSAHPMLAHFRFLSEHVHAGSTAKMTIPGPSMLHYRGGRKMIDKSVYPEMDAFYADVGSA
jgi:5-methyltetrahydropteroyltriglutamate--homocysteine methyltransferase